MTIQKEARTAVPGDARDANDAQTWRAAQQFDTTSPAPRQIELEFRTHRGGMFRVRINASDPHWRARALAALPDPLSPEAFAIAHAPHTQAEALRWARICEEEEERRAREAKLGLLLALIQRRRTLNRLRAKWGRKL